MQRRAFHHMLAGSALAGTGLLSLPALAQAGFKEGKDFMRLKQPVPVDARRLRNPRTGMMLVAAAGPGSILAMGAIAAVVLGLMARVSAVRKPTRCVPPSLVWMLLAKVRMVSL